MSNMHESQVRTFKALNKVRVYKKGNGKKKE